MIQRRDKGFTLIEMVLSIVLMSIIGIGISYIIPYPMQAYLTANARGELSDLAGSFLMPLSRDIQQALPNSPRVKSDSTRVALEFIPIVSAGRYRADGPGTAGDILDFSQSDNSFNIMTDPDTFLPSDDPGIYRVVIDNIGQYAYNGGSIDYDQPLEGMNVYADAYAGAPGLIPLQSNVVTPTTTTVTLSNVTVSGNPEVRVALSAPFRFSLESPNHLVYLVNTAVSYVCDVSSGTLTKYYDYNPTNAQSLSPGDLGAQSALVLNNVTACSFQYDPGTATRSGTVSVEITLTNDQQESATFLQQVQVKNAA